MPFVSDLLLSIVENEGAASALVSYRVVGSPEDIQERRTYIETIELIGVDQLPGEDGRNDPIIGGRADAALTFPVSSPLRIRHLALPSARLDEDSGGSGTAGATPDEILARVTLSHAVSAESNTVTLHA